ncbi:hypothetical protein J2755_001847 [Methanohalophilus levihalophilus]|uniref:hypothetical protein n=1 Tax=Methanohalophilus levihalophilus TaxID=1431282 RepID=UPI001AE70551|nr:hypothetical protein [Methanohalophilus levihalophilus]MBP2030899.1 hypothetical protein [Methanohalophilus levihalophilus]
MGMITDIATLNNAYYGEGVYDLYAAPFPAAEYTWMIAVIILGLLALWQARSFVSQF